MLVGWHGCSRRLALAFDGCVLIMTMHLVSCVHDQTMEREFAPSLLGRTASGRCLVPALPCHSPPPPSCASVSPSGRSATIRWRLCVADHWSLAAALLGTPAQHHRTGHNGGGGCVAWHRRGRPLAPHVVDSVAFTTLRASGDFPQPGRTAAARVAVFSSWIAPRHCA